MQECGALLHGAKGLSGGAAAAGGSDAEPGHDLVLTYGTGGFA